MQCPLIFGYLFIFMNENLILIKNHVYEVSSYTPGHNTRPAARCWKSLNYTPQNQSQNKQQRLSNTQLQKHFFYYRYDTLLQKLPCLKGTLKRLQGTLLESSFSHRSNIWNMVLGCLMWIVWMEWNSCLFEDT